jgi:hypothetical protein
MILNKLQLLALTSGLLTTYLLYQFSLEVWCWAYGLMYY